MDPASAIGVAAAAVQFLDTSLKALEICRQIRDDSTSSTLRNKELEDSLRKLKETRKDLESPTIRVPKKVKDIATKCATTSDDLLRVLEDVRGAGKPVSKMKATYPALRGRRTIEKHEKSLKEWQRLLDRALLQDVW